jgi:hypothetical protein
VVLAVTMIPSAGGLGRRWRGALAAAFVLWLSMLPVIAVYGFGG